MENDENQYLLECESDNSYCVVYQDAIIYNKNISLECGAIVWFMYKSKESSKPYRGKIVEISDDGDLLFSLAEKLSASREGSNKTKNPAKVNLVTKRSVNKTDNKDLKNKIVDDADNAQTVARKKAAKLEEIHIISEIKSKGKAYEPTSNLAVSEDLKLLEKLKLLTIDSQQFTDRLVQVTIELEQLIADNNINKPKKSVASKSDTGIWSGNLKRIANEKSKEAFKYDSEISCSSPKAKKYSEDFDFGNQQFSDDSDDNINEVIAPKKLEAKRMNLEASSSKIEIDDDLEDIDSMWTLKYEKKTEKTIELVKESNIYVDKVALECAKKSASSPNVLARMLLELIFKKEALKKCSWSGGSVNGKGKDNKAKSPALNLEGRQALLAYVTSQAEKLGWNFNNQSMMQSIRAKIAGFKNL